MNSHIFTIRENLRILGFHYVLWSEGLSARTLYKIWIAYGMNRHEANRHASTNYI